jgi:hypothetical protein
VSLDNKPLAPDNPASESSRRSVFLAGGLIAAIGLLLAAAYFPLMFYSWASYDDEGVFVVSLRELINHHGSLYTTIWSDKYGPFYYFVMSTVFRLIHQQPTLENGRWIVLVVTSMTASLFAAAVWRVTKSLTGAVLCEVAAFIILIQVAGNEPLHPGSLSVLLVAVVAYEISSYAVNRGRTQLIGMGAAAGALLMTKLNSGGLVVIALVALFVVGSSQAPRWARLAVAGLTALTPVVLMLQRASANWVAIFAFLVIASVVAISVLMAIDLLLFPKSSLLWVALGAAAVAICSLIFPLVTGTPISAVLTGVFIRPLDQAGQLTVPANVNIDWFTLVATAAGIYAAVALRSRPGESPPAATNWANAALAALGLWLLGFGATAVAHGNAVAQWLPLLALLPAAAIFCTNGEAIRLALRALVLLAALQILVAYPVAGSQVAWGTAAMTVPCAIAIAVGIDRTETWRKASRLTKNLVTALLCLGLVVASDVIPLNVWHTYLNNPALALPGTGLMRIDPAVEVELQQLVQAIHSQCDTFYGVPDENSLYIFADFEPFTGMLADRPDGLNVSQQDQIVKRLQETSSTGERVCIVRDTSQGNELVFGPLSVALSQYTNVVESVGNYTIARHN